MFSKKVNKKKKNHKFAFSTTLVIFLVASVAISASIVPKNAFAQLDPITSCFIANAIINPSYYQAEQNFINSLPNDKLFTKLSAEVGNGPIQNNVDLSNLLKNPNLILGDQKEIQNEIANHLAVAGFAQLKQNVLMLA